MDHVILLYSTVDHVTLYTWIYVYACKSINISIFRYFHSVGNGFHNLQWTRHLDGNAYV